MVRPLLFPFAVALAAWPLATGCSSSSNPGAPDGAAPVPVTSDAQSDSPGEDSGPNACADASVRTIQASSYDQSCTVDTDCRLIGEGNACTPCAFNCPSSGAINAGALAQYNSDVANTPAVAASFNGQTCFAGCPAAFGPCCVGGKCQLSTTGQCPVPDAGVDAASDACQCPAPDADVDACAPPIVCSGACVSGAHNVSTMVDGCLVTRCCVPDDAGAD
jgi:hypothetical protein